MMWLAVSILACMAQLALAAYAPDRITSLPGWDGALPSKQYSGYLNVSGTASHLHYWFVESEEVDPATAPTLLWLNGGPGCSSLDGFIYEHGPFEVDPTDHTKLNLREYRWNRMVNMLYIEAPVGVGFSYSDDANYACDDQRTAKENLGAVEAFFGMFPELKNNQFFITGESYAGIYVPTLAYAIVEADKAGTYNGAKLSGIAVGNGCSGSEIGICGSGPQGTFYEWSYLLQTALVSPALKVAVDASCDWKSAANNTPDALSEKCKSLLRDASSEIGNINMYDIYGECISSTGKCEEMSGEQVLRGKVPQRPTSLFSDDDPGRITPKGPFECINSAAASDYLNQPAVMEALHVRPPGFCWAVCNTAPGWSYNQTEKNLPASVYPTLVGAVRVLIYNGDWDACVPHTDGYGWTAGMGYAVDSEWHAWLYSSITGNGKQVGGYARSYDVSAVGSGKGSFEFITVRGGRHEVPETAPGQAYEMVSRLIADINF